MKKIIFFLLLLSLKLVALGPEISPAWSAAADAVPTRQRPLQVDIGAGTVSVLAQVNGKYFFQNTRHAVVFSGGSNGEKALFRSYAAPEEFHAALLKVGLKAGNNMTKENASRTFVQGDLLDVTVTWKGAERDYGLDEVINDSNKKPFQIRFGGNLKNALQFKTGCLLCLDSCPVGIASNANYAYGAVEKRGEAAFRGNKAVLPPDGSLVVIKVRARK